MRWQGRRQSSNVEDRRGRRGPGTPVVAGGGAGVLVLALIIFALGGNPLALLTGGGGPGSGAGGGGVLGPGGGSYTPTVEEQQLAEMVGVVLADTEDVWNDLMARAGRDYPEPTLVLFSGSVESACGIAGSSVGPFYCPGDAKVYIDLGFFIEMGEKLNAEGDFAQAYVVAHEVGHHVQNLLGASDYVHAQRNKVSEEEYNRLSVRLELQADFYAGVWAHHAQRTKNILEPGDVQEAIRAAGAVGDDRLQLRGQGYVVPDSFTHGTSEQRARWFMRGFETGDPAQGDTFSVPYDRL